MLFRSATSTASALPLTLAIAPHLTPLDKTHLGNGFVEFGVVDLTKAPPEFLLAVAGNAGGCHGSYSAAMLKGELASAFFLASISML